jgi:hypothetical protein
MSMKKTDLEKMKARKLSAGGANTPDRFGKGSAAHGKQRKAKYAGGVPLALKLLGKDAEGK